MAPNQIQAEWARLWITSLADAGIERVVISPGSRSTPLVLAVAAEPRMTAVDVIDERAAGFFALGQARVTGKPSLLICTSGTAGANYLPAVIEARHAAVPLLVLTADRPIELAHCGANQTIDQAGLFGAQVRAFFDLGSAEESLLALRALRRTAAQAALATRFPEPGAVHCNLRLRKPLEPPAARSGDEIELRETIDALLARPLPRASIPRRIPAQEDLDELAAACCEAERGLVICGPADLSQAALGPLVRDLGRRTGFPIYADPASQLRRQSLEGPGVVWVDSLDALVAGASFHRQRRPGLILQVGRAPISAAWDRGLGELAASDSLLEHWVLSSQGWQDPQSSASRLLTGDLAPMLGAFLDLLPEVPVSTAWADVWSRAEEIARRSLAEELAAEDRLSEGAVARSVVEALPPGGLLVAGNSLPIRQLDTWGGRGEILVASQRGTSGIEGLVAGAAGAAGAHGGPAVLLLGDVSFTHDLSGLAAACKVRAPLVVVVVQNRGGRIFEQLPVYHHPAAKDALDHWITPPEIDLSAAGAMFGVPFTRVDTKAELVRALAEGLQRRSPTLIEAMVPASGARQRNQSLRDRLESRLGCLDPDS